MVQLDIDKSSISRVTFAWDLAQRFEADLIGFVAAEARIIVPAGDSGIVAADAMRHQIEEIEGRLEALKQEFESLTQNSGRASWRGFVGNPTRMLAMHARAADLVVAGSPRMGLAADHLRAVDVGSLVISTGRPLLLAADNLAPLRADNVLVAWKDAREARRAVVDAMPLLNRAREVLVVTLEDDDAKSARESVADVVRFLVTHGVKARSDVIGIGGADNSEALAQVAREIDADLIVAGAYGRSRLREWVFGGVTRPLLRDNTVNRLISN